MIIIDTSTLSNQDIHVALLVHTYTAKADREIVVNVYADQIAGNGAYTVYLTKQKLGAGSFYASIHTTETVISGETAKWFSTIPLSVKETDVIKVYLLGLAGDTTTPDIITEIVDIDPLVQFAGVSQGGGANNTIVLASTGSPATNDLVNGSVIRILGGTGAGQARAITAYVASTKVATVGRNWVTNPDNTSVYEILSLSVPQVNDSLAVLVQSGTGTGQLSITSGVVAASVSADVGITQAGADKVWGTTARALTDKANFTLSTAGILAIWNQLTADAGIVANTFAAGMKSVITTLAGITSLPNWLRAMIRSSTADATAKTEINTGGGTYDEATDSAQAIGIVQAQNSVYLSEAVGAINILVNGPFIVVTGSTALSIIASTGVHEADALGGTLIFTSGALQNEPRAISGFTLSGSNEAFAVSTPFTEAPTAGDEFYVIPIIASGGGGTGLTAQQTRDAMKLAPTAGAPATGSIDEQLDTIEGVTNQIGANPVTITLQTAVVGNAVSLYNAVDIDFSLTGLTDFSGWSELWFTAKSSVRDADSQSLLQLKVSATPNPATDGLLYLQGNQQTKTNGSITVTGTTAIRIQVAAAVAANLIPDSNGTWDIKVLKNSKVVPVTEGGPFSIVGVVTDSIA